MSNSTNTGCPPTAADGVFTGIVTAAFASPFVVLTVVFLCKMIKRGMKERAEKALGEKCQACGSRQCCAKKTDSSSISMAASPGSYTVTTSQTDPKHDDYVMTEDCATTRIISDETEEDPDAQSLSQDPDTPKKSEERR